MPREPFSVRGRRVVVVGAARSGIVTQAAMLSAGGLSEIDPAAAALQEIPMLFRSLAEQQYVRDKMRADVDRRMLAKGFVVLFWGDSGWVRFFSRNAGIRPADFKSMKIFVTASGSTVT